MTDAVAITTAGFLPSSTAGYVRGAPMAGQAGSGFDQVIDKSLKTIKSKSDAKEADITMHKTNIDKKIDIKHSKKEDKLKLFDQLDNEEILAEFQALFQEIKEVVMKFLDLSELELSQLMAEEGITTFDLANVNLLRQLVLKSQGETDVISFLTDELLTGDFNYLIQAIETIIEDHGLEMDLEQLDKSVKDMLFEQMPDESKKSMVKDTMNKLDFNISNKPSQDDGVRDTKSVNVTSFENPDLKSQKVEINSQEHDKTNDHDLEKNEKWDLFVDNLTGAFEEARTEFAKDAVEITELREIANQIVEKVKVIIEPGQTSMELQLKPEHLGNINLSISSKDGSMIAHFSVENELVKEAIESQVQILKDALNEQQVKVEAIEVTVQNYEFQQKGRDSEYKKQESSYKKSKNKISLNEALAMDELIEEQPMEINTTGITGQQMLEAGLQIDYTA